MIRAYLLDADQEALSLLAKMLQQTGEVDIVGKSMSPYIAIEQVIQLSPDVIFLDIELPGLYGIAVAERIRNHLPSIQIVFVTLHKHYALLAFEQKAIDYVLKPLDRERLGKTVTRLLKEWVKCRK